ncbi:MAG: NfeD family protein [Salinivirgaceae bacterium]|jgi:membrane-bound ClpP family serine protease|nr:NfeD family protein [Salinivirgaceae bacterium]
MGATIAVGLLIFVGVLLLLLEFLVIPGTTVAAIGGILFMAGGIYLAYESFGATTGNYVLWGTLAFLMLAIVWALRSGTWRKFMLNTNVSGMVSETKLSDEVKPGDEGICISRLNPMGRIRINGKSYEARSYDSYVDEKQPVKVIKVEMNTLIVKHLTN